MRGGKKPLGGKPASKPPRVVAFAPTDDQRHEVSVLTAGGMTREQIAQVFGVTPGAVLRACAFELSTGASQRRAEVVRTVFDCAMKGNVTAARAFLARPANTGGPLANAAVVGKKELRNVEAMTAADDTEWGGVASRMN